MRNLVKDAKVILVSTGAAAGQTEVDTSIVDTAGYDGVAFIAILGTVVDTCVLQLTTQGNTANSTSGMAAQGAQTPSVTALGSSNTLLIADTVFPAGSKSNRYVRAALTRTVANATVLAIVAVLYESKNRPVTPDASVLASAFALGS